MTDYQTQLTTVLNKASAAAGDTEAFEAAYAEYEQLVAERNAERAVSQQRFRKVQLGVMIALPLTLLAISALVLGPTLSR